jgi:uncharacterized protein HemX
MPSFILVIAQAATDHTGQVVSVLIAVIGAGGGVLTGWLAIRKARAAESAANLAQTHENKIKEVEQQFKVRDDIIKLQGEEIKRKDEQISRFEGRLEALNVENDELLVRIRELRRQLVEKEGD